MTFVSKSLKLGWMRISKRSIWGLNILLVLQVNTGNLFQDTFNTHISINKYNWVFRKVMYFEPHNYLRFGLILFVAKFIFSVFNQNAWKNSPGWCGSVDWSPACEPSGCWFDSQSGHMPGLQTRSPVGDSWEGTTHWCFSPSLSPFPSL